MLGNAVPKSHDLWLQKIPLCNLTAVIQNLKAFHFTVKKFLVGNTAPKSDDLQPQTMPQTKTLSQH